jgi:hypothetical protein
MARLLSRDELMAFNVRRYYAENPIAWRVVAAYITGEPLPDGTKPLSLRSIDFFVRRLTQTHPPLARKYNALKAGRHKQNFDPFRRSERHVIELHGIALETTYAQLAFFMWMIQSGALALAEASREDIVSSRRSVENDNDSRTDSTFTTALTASSKSLPALASGPAVLRLSLS